MKISLLGNFLYLVIPEICKEPISGCSVLFRHYENPGLRVVKNITIEFRSSRFFSSRNCSIRLGLLKHFFSPRLIFEWPFHNISKTIFLHIVCNDKPINNIFPIYRFISFCNIGSTSIILMSNYRLRLILSF